VLFLLFVLGVPSFAFLFQYGTDMYAAVRFSEYSDEDLCRANSSLEYAVGSQQQLTLTPVGVTAVKEMQRRGLTSIKCWELLPPLSQESLKSLIQEEPLEENKDTKTEPSKPSIQNNILKDTSAPVEIQKAP
jgi:hypothetical protein